MEDEVKLGQFWVIFARSWLRWARPRLSRGDSYRSNKFAVAARPVLAPRRLIQVALSQPRKTATLLVTAGGLAVGLALASCTGSPISSLSPSSGNQSATAESLLGLNSMAERSNGGQRELTAPEKKVISDAVALSIKDPASAQYRWPKISVADEGSVNYCGMVNAKSAYPAYNGWQAYIVEAKVTGGKVSSAVVGLIAGGKDVAIVRKMCKKYDLDPGQPG
jgi:hypothetical protein